MKKRILALLLCVLLLSVPVMPSAASDAPVITLQPQSYHYPQYSVAVYTVKATGQNLTATWYIKYQGVTYNLSDNTNGMEPWEGFAGENYGPMEDGPNTFSWFFGGIEEGLNGAEIWCVLEDGHYDVESAHAIITVQGSALPPEILQLPTSLTVKRGETAQLRCVAKSNNASQLVFQWYETATGRLMDIQAMDGEEADYIFLNTQNVGTRYYVCLVRASDGGMAYSSVVPVTVIDSTPAGEPPVLLTKTLPQATVGEDYGFILEADRHDAEFSVSYNPGGANDFEKTGLSLTVEGMLIGKPTKAGTYTFTVCVSNAYGEGYGVLSLKVEEISAEDPTQVTTEPQGIEAATTEPMGTEEVPTEPVPTEGKPPVQTQKPSDSTDSFPWWGYLLIGLAAVGVGVGATLLLVKKKA